MGTTHEMYRYLRLREGMRCDACTASSHSPLRSAEEAEAEALCRCCYGTGFVCGYVLSGTIQFAEKRTARQELHAEGDVAFVATEGYVPYNKHLVPQDVLVDAEGTRWHVVSMESMTGPQKWHVHLRTLRDYEGAARFPLKHRVLRETEG
jgi:hypothetical protein